MSTMKAAVLHNFSRERPRAYTSAERLLERVRNEVIASGETYKAVALRTGVSQTTVQRLASGVTRWPRPTTLFPLLVALKLELQVVKRNA